MIRPVQGFDQLTDHIVAPNHVHRTTNSFIWYQLKLLTYIQLRSAIQFLHASVL